jgi:enediyne biosynthesis protein E4
VYWNDHNGKFRDISQRSGPGATTPFNIHGLAMADFHNDGSVELLVNHSHDHPSLLKNTGERGNRILLVLHGTKSNRDAIGARVTLRIGKHQQLQDVRSGGGYDSQSDLRLHFRLGSATEIDSLHIAWPSGAVQFLAKVKGNRILTVIETPRR